MDSFFLYLQDIYRVETVVRKKKVEIECQKALSRKEKKIQNKVYFQSKLEILKNNENVKHFLVFSVQTFEKKL